MTCEEVMKKDPECVTLGDTVEQAARIMRDENVGFIPVCKEDDTIAGTITDRDLAIRVLAEHKSFDTKVDDILTSEVVACSPKDDLRKAEELMAQKHKSRIMCVDESGKLLGVISLSDIARQGRSSTAAQTLSSVTEREVRT